MDKKHIKQKEDQKFALKKNSSEDCFSTSFSTSCSPESSSTSEPSVGGCVGNTIYVDSICGDDETARPFSSSYPYQTIKAAIGAAVGPAKNAVIEILVRPGTYPEGRIFLINNIS